MFYLQKELYRKREIEICKLKSHPFTFAMVFVSAIENHYYRFRPYGKQFNFRFRLD